jgi:hypothetical protein
MTHKERTVPTIPEYKGKFGNPPYGADEDNKVMFDIAGSILSRVSMCFILDIVYYTMC